MSDAMSEFLKELKRTHDCGALRAADVGKKVVLFGWVSSRRDHGGCVFIDLRDRGGFTQVVFEPSVNVEAHTLAGELRSEFCIGVTGTVVDRGAGRNPKIPTGEIEVHCDRLTIFSRSETPPFELTDDDQHQREPAPQAPVPRPAPPVAAEELPAALGDLPDHPAGADRARASSRSRRRSW